MKDIHELLNIETDEILVVCGCSTKTSKAKGEGCC